jgi:uncharacterized small protein (DUF1192 family)
MITKAQAIASLREGAEWVLRGDELEWLDQNQTQPTDAEIDAEVARLEAEYEAKSYARSRAAEYPSLQEQLDMQYWDAINGTTNWADAIAAVKTKYPKPE